MAPARIDIRKLHRLLTGGKTQRECAQVFGVSESAISYARRKLRVRPSAGQFDATQELQRIHRQIGEFLDALMQSSEDDGEAISGTERGFREDVAPNK